MTKTKHKRKPRPLNKENITFLDSLYNRSMRAYNKTIKRLATKYNVKLTCNGEYDEIDVDGHPNEVNALFDEVEQEHSKSKSFGLLCRALNQYTKGNQKKYLATKED